MNRTQRRVLRDLKAHATRNGPESWSIRHVEQCPSEAYVLADPPYAIKMKTLRALLDAGVVEEIDDQAVDIHYRVAGISKHETRI